MNRCYGVSVHLAFLARGGVNGYLHYLYWGDSLALSRTLRYMPIQAAAAKGMAVREEGILHIEDVNIVDGTPLLDLKPYLPTLWLTKR